MKKKEGDGFYFLHGSRDNTPIRPLYPSGSLLSTLGGIALDSPPSNTAGTIGFKKRVLAPPPGLHKESPEEVDIDYSHLEYGIQAILEEEDKEETSIGNNETIKKTIFEKASPIEKKKNEATSKEPNSSKDESNEEEESIQIVKDVRSNIKKNNVKDSNKVSKKQKKNRIVVEEKKTKKTKDPTTKNNNIIMEQEERVVINSTIQDSTMWWTGLSPILLLIQVYFWKSTVNLISLHRFALTFAVTDPLALSFITLYKLPLISNIYPWIPCWVTFALWYTFLFHMLCFGHPLAHYYRLPMIMMLVVECIYNTHYLFIMSSADLLILSFTLCSYTTRNVSSLLNVYSISVQGLLPSI